MKEITISADELERRINASIEARKLREEKTRGRDRKRSHDFYYSHKL